MAIEGLRGKLSHAMRLRRPDNAQTAERKEKEDAWLKKSANAWSVFNAPTPEFRTSKERLDQLWEFQVKRYIDLGFHTELGMLAEEYKASTPRFLPQPDGYSTPLIVESKIPIERQFKLAGIDINQRQLKNIQKWKDRPKSRYTVWTRDASRYLRQNVETAVRQFGSDEYACSMGEATALYLQRPQIFNEQGVYALDPDSHYQGKASYLHTYNGQPWVDTIITNTSPPPIKLGLLSCFNKINTTVESIRGEA